MTDKEIKERKEALFAEMIKEENMEDLFGHIRTLLNMPDLKFTYNVETAWNHSKFVSFSSENIADKPIVCLAWKEFRVEQFHSKICFDYETNDIFYWFTVAFHYKQYDGGSNYSEIANVIFNEDGEWVFNADCEGR